jgi:hypothetical protein
MDPRKLIKLAGPSDFSYFICNNNKLVIIGETHNYVNNDKEYYDIHKWLRDIIEITDKSIDLYIEEDEVDYLETIKYYSPICKNIGEYNKPLDAIRCAFSKYERYNFMIHRIDPRTLFGGKSIYIRDNKNFNRFDFLDIDYYAQKNCINITKFLCGICRDKQCEDLYFEYLNKIDLFFPDLILNKDTHTELFWHLLERKIKNLDIDRFNDLFLNTIDSIINPEKGNFPLSIIILAACQLDYFALLEYISNPGEISIFYAGSIHSEFWNIFISKWYNTDDEPIESELYKCQYYLYPDHIKFDEPFDLLEDL